MINFYKNLVFTAISNFLIPIVFQPDSETFYIFNLDYLIQQNS